jgi:hypothetical protein
MRNVVKATQTDAAGREIYPNLVPIANRWNESMGIEVRYPDAHASFITRCHKAGQTRPTPRHARNPDIATPWA